MKNNFISAISTKDARTENDQVTNSTSGSACVDLFFTLGAVRKLMNDQQGKKRVITKFEQAFNEDPLVATKLLFWARNVRGGAGERNVFREIAKHMANADNETILKNIEHIPFFGRWDDLMLFVDTPYENNALDLYAKALKDGDALASKWAPRLSGKNNPAKKIFGNKLRTKMDLDPKSYRKLIVGLTNVVETAMCNKSWEEIDYEKVPSLAITRYNKAFMKHDYARFNKFGEDVTEGDAKINVGAVYPYDIINTLKQGENDTVVEAQWSKQIDFMEDSKERLFTMVDTSGSMAVKVSGSVSAMDVAISLGLYISERTKGPFKDSFLTFSRNPQIQTVNGNLRQRYNQMSMSEWGMNTNVEKAFTHILERSVAHKLSNDELPTVLLIISDMEFDYCVQDSNATAMENIQKQYSNHGFNVPKIVFWNVDNRHGNAPVTFKESGTALVSGLSPSILKGILKGNITNPIEVMKDTISDEVYDRIII